MGFRSTFITKSSRLKIPDWFRDKYEEWIFFHRNRDGNYYLPIASKNEVKTYFTGSDLDSDLQKVLNEGNDSEDSVIFVWLHECGGITRVQVFRDKIIFTEPSYSEWEIVEDSTHGPQCTRPCGFIVEE